MRSIRGFLLGVLAAVSMSLVASQQIINVATPNSGLGDPAFTAFSKSNANFTELYSTLLTPTLSANEVFASPSTIGGIPAFRPLTAADLPANVNASVSGMIYVLPSGDTTGTQDQANIQAAAAALAASNRLPPLATSFFATKKIILGPGTFYFTSNNLNIAFLPPATTLKMSGFWLQGSGKNVTSIDYNPLVSGPFMVNQNWLNVKMSDMTFIGHDVNSDFMWSQEQAGLSNVQDYTFQDVEWNGNWNTIFRLTGGNNNSEWKFDRDTVAGAVTNWIYVPTAVATAITSGSNSIGATNTQGQIAVGDTGFFSNSVSPLFGNTQYYVVAATTSTFKVSTTKGGAPVTFSANGTPTFQTGNDQFLNFWFSKCKFDTGTSAGQWLAMNAGGSIKIRDSDISGHNPSSVTYVFNLLNSAHANGVMNFEVDGLRVEHAGNNSRLIHSQWGGGAISFNNLDESSQAGLRTTSNAYANYEIVNAQGPTISYTNSQLMGKHSYTNNVNNFALQSQITYDSVTLLDNPTAANFITITNVGNTGGYPRIRFVKSRNNLSSSLVSYHEVVDTDLNWNLSMGGQTDTKVTSCVGSNSDWPIGGGNIQFRLPLNAMITRIRYWNPGGSGSGSAYNYSIQTTEGSPTVLATISGANASTPVAASAMTSVTPNFVMTTDAARTIEILDSASRAGVFTGLYCLIDYIG